MNDTYTAITNDLNYLAHEGRKGMHWHVWGGPGIRYQNHAVYAKYDKRYANKKFGSAPYPKTYDEKAGLKLKTSDSTMFNDMKACNPNFNPYDPGTTHNCLFCTNAYDMRRRGYDVSANRNDKDRNFNQGIKKYYPKAKFEQIASSNEGTDKTYRGMRKALISQNTTRDAEKIYQDIYKALSSQGNGARGHLLIEFKHGWGGHSLAYEIKNNKPIILDCQSGTVGNLRNIAGETENAFCVRLDNVAFNPRTIKGAVN